MDSSPMVAAATSAQDNPVPTTLSLRKVEFHLARKPESFSKCINPDFKLETLNPNSKAAGTLVACSSSSSSSGLGARKGADVPDFFEDAVLSFRMPLRRIGAGLENLGNTCFLNSVIQCLTYTEPLVGYLQSGKHQTTCRVAGFCALCAIQRHVSRALQASGRSLAPKDLVSHLRSVSRNFRNARQEDAHEYMIHLLESMHKCCLPSGVQAESPGAYEKSLVHRIFGGRLRSQVKCLQCSHCSNTFDPFLDLSLEIVKADSLYKALRNFTAPEQLDGGERQYKCERCKQKVRALKQLTVSRAPYVLTIHLKRFRSHFSGQKIDKKVQFGSTLDLKPFVTGDYEGDLTYTLYGVLVHAGCSTHSGHYYCFVRTSNGLWYSLDDNRVIQVSERIVMEQKAYMLFYVRDRKKFVSKKAMDMVQKENLIQTMRNVSSSIPNVNHAAAEKSTKEAIQSGLSVKHAETSKPSAIVVQPNSSSSLKQELNHNSGKISLAHVEYSKPSEVVVQLNSSNTLKQELDHTSGKLPSEPSVSGNSKFLIPKSNSDEMMHSTKLAENKRVQYNDVATVVGAGSDINNAPNSDSVLLQQKAPNLFCASTVANGLGDATSEVVKDDKTITVTLSNPTIQENTERKKLKNTKAGKSRINEQRVDELLSRGNLLRQGPVKKISKSRVVGMHFSSKMLYSAALNLRRKKKCKRMKSQTKLTFNENLLNGSCSREGEKDASKDVAKYSNCNLLLEKSEGNEVLKSRVNSSPAVLANGDLSKETSCMEVQCKESDSSCAEKQNLLQQNGTFKETTVLRWDGLELPSENAEDNGPEVVTIGHVLDEWDEEYDRGKRKKVRGSRTEFGGPNVFQEISSKKAKLKAKTGQRISINEPFRI